MMRRYRPLILAAVCVCLCVAIVACSQQGRAPTTGAPALASGAQIQGVNLNDPIRCAIEEGPIEIVAAKNEWVSFAVQIAKLPSPTKKGSSNSLRIAPPRLNDGDGRLD